MSQIHHQPAFLNRREKEIWKEEELLVCAFIRLLCQNTVIKTSQSTYHYYTTEHRDFQKINRGSILALKTSFQIFYCLRLSPFYWKLNFQMSIFIDTLYLYLYQCQTYLWPTHPFLCLNPTECDGFQQSNMQPRYKK